LIDEKVLIDVMTLVSILGKNHIYKIRLLPFSLQCLQTIQESTENQRIQLEKIGMIQ
jgi:hypothetical protein